MNTWKKEFQNPGREHRSQPFWAWNADLSEEEIVWQIKEMAKQGMGGFFMHSREGLETPYMGEKWLSCIRAAVEEAQKQGMRAWLYDEDRWPSGTAGGQVTALGDANRLKGLTLEVCRGKRAGEVWARFAEEKETMGTDAGDGLPEDGLFLAVYAARAEGMEIFSYRRLFPEKEQPLPLEEGEALLAARLECSAGSAWFNGQTPPDNLNPDTVACFLEKTHQVYFRTVGEAFGKVVPGCFTDEPSLADRHAAFPPDRSWIPWTYGFCRYYSQKRGRNVLDTLPCVYFNGPESTKARYDYWHTLSDRYLETYSKTISKWCREHGIAFTGHFLQEDKLGLCARVNGSVMPHYRYQMVPGIDMLREETREYLTVKQCTSVANQFGKKEVLTETYGCTGWDFTFEGMKWIGDWQYVLGVNTRCPHLALYSLKGLRKRDYPPSFNYNTSWWEKNHVTEDYFARLGVVLKQGKPVRKLLVLHPMGTAWGRLGVSPYGNPVRRLERDVPGINQYGNDFNRLLEELSRQHIDYDLGDETLMESDGWADKFRLGIGEAGYEAVLVPSGDTWRAHTLGLLRTFADQGGKIFWMEPLPWLTDGEADADGLISGLLEHGQSICCSSMMEAMTLLGDHGLRTLEITDAQGSQVREILALLKRTEGEDILFLVNNHRERCMGFRVSLPKRDSGIRLAGVEEWDPLNGARWAVRWAETRDAVVFDRELGPCGSALYILQWGGQQEETLPNGDGKKMQDDFPGQERHPDHRPVPGKRLSVFEDTVPVRLTQPNVYVFDRCCWALVPAKEGMDTAGLADCRTDKTAGQDKAKKKNAEESNNCRNCDHWKEEAEIWQVQRQIREFLGMRENDSGEQIQRYCWVHGKEAGKGRRIRLKLTVSVDVPSLGPVWLAAEDAGEIDLYVNGIRQQEGVQGWYLDKSFGKRPVRGLRQGVNEIVAEMMYKETSELEMYYLLGDFSVWRDAARGRVIRGPVRELTCGDWTLQGLLHYAGSVVYQYELPRPREDAAGYLLKLGRFSAVCAAVRLNGEETDIPWKERRDVWIPASRMQERNCLEIELYSGPRNMLGPFHLAGGRPWTTNAGCFRAEGGNRTANYQTVPYGQLEAAELWAVREE